MREYEQFLLAFCYAIHEAEKMAQDERKKELFGVGYFPELLINKNEKVRIEIRKENVNHNAHISI